MPKNAEASRAKEAPMSVKIDPEARFIGVGFVLGVLLVLLFVGIAYGISLRSGFYGAPPKANHFIH